MEFTEEVSSLSIVELKNLIDITRAEVKSREAKRMAEKVENFFISLQSLADTYPEIKIHIGEDAANTFFLEEIDLESSHLNENGNIEICIGFNDNSL